MAKKRKLEEEHIVAAGEEEEYSEEIIGDGEDEEFEYEVEEVEFEEEDEEEEEEYEEDDPHKDGDVAEEPIPSKNAGGGARDPSPVQSNNDGGVVEMKKEKENEEEEPILSVIAAFSKEALVELLYDAAGRHADVAARVRASAVVDPSQRKIFVHGLRWDTTSEILSQEFSKYGEIEDCRVIADKTTGRSKGYGFVLFKTCRAARQALMEPQKLINERMTSSQLASIGPIAPALPQKPPLPVHTQRKIFVSNVGEEMDPEKVKDFFSKYGEIEEGPLGLDRETGKAKGFCLFTYKTVESAKSALREPHKQFEGVTLYCQQAIDGPKPHKSVVARNQQFVDNVASGVVDSTMMPVPLPLPPPPYMQVPPMMQQPQPMNMDPAAVGQALTTLIAQGGGMNLLGALGAATGLLNNSGMVPGFAGPVVQGGYGMASGVNMGSNGMEGSWNQGGYPPNQMRWQGRGRGHHGPWPPRMDQ